MSSRLFLEVRERRGLAYYVYAVNSSFTDAGTLFSQAGVDLQRAEEAVEVIANEFKQARRGARAGRGAREGACARQGTVRPADGEPERADPVRAAPRGAGRAAAEPTEVLAGLDAVTVEDVLRVAQDVIGSQGLRAAVIGPFDDASKFEALL